MIFFGATRRTRRQALQTLTWDFVSDTGIVEPAAVHTPFFERFKTMIRSAEASAPKWWNPTLTRQANPRQKSFFRQTSATVFAPWDTRSPLFWAC